VLVDARWAGIYDFRDAKVWRAQGFLDHGEALGVAGVTE
jgi:hypothetical protein